MALPIVNAPSYETNLPSTGEMITYRPYVVKEEKMLMIALETKDQKQIMRAMKDVISACVQSEINVDNLTSFDIEWLFLKLRSKSVGERVDLKLKCQQGDCKGTTDVNINLEDIQLEGEVAKDRTIKLTDEIGVVLNYPSVGMMEKLNLNEVEGVKGAFDIIVSSIETIFDADNVYDCKTETRASIEAFIDNLNSAQFSKISEFFQSVPVLQHNLNWSCMACGKENDIELKGIQSFFT